MVQLTLRPVVSTACLLLMTLLLLPVGATASSQPDFVELIEHNRAAVVSIDTSREMTRSRGPESLPIPEDSPFYDYFRRFFEEQQGPRRGEPRRQRPASIGSGFILTEDGYLLTNAHVVDGSARVTVTLSDRTEYQAEIIGTDARTDIALLKIDAGDLPFVRIGDPQALKVGQWVLAIGSPFGFNYTATQGIVSGLGRSLPSGNYVPYIQTDAAVNPGNSGGPLFNLDGEVIGINSQIYSRTGGYQGLSFAIPIDVAMDVVEQLRDTGRVARGWLGVLIQEVTAELATSFGLERPRGALVSQVLPGSPAAKAGFQAGDIILGFNDDAIIRSNELPPLVGLVRPGNSAAVSVFRDGEELLIEVVIEELPDDPNALARAPSVPQQPEVNRLGVIVSTPDPEDEVDNGVRVTQLEPGPAAEAGIEPGDLIIRLDNRVITDVEQFEALVQELPADRPISVLIQRDGGSVFLAMTLNDD